MKTIVIPTFAKIILVLLAATGAPVAYADESAAAKTEKTFNGTITVVNAQERIVKVKRFPFTKSFSLGDHCVVSVGEKPDASLADLRPGQKIQVSYQNAAGVLVASRLKQVPMTRIGRVEHIDPEKHSLTLRNGKTTTTFALADNCKVTLAGGKEGKWDALQPGYKVTVWYDLPGEGAVARRVELKYETFTGNLTAVDVQTRTVKAKHLVGGKAFRLARDCRISVPGKADADLNDLRLGQKFTFSFEEVDGVNVANFIASADASPPDKIAASAR